MKGSGEKAVLWPSVFLWVRDSLFIHLLLYNGWQSTPSRKWINRRGQRYPSPRTLSCLLVVTGSVVASLHTCFSARSTSPVVMHCICGRFLTSVFNLGKSVGFKFYPMGNSTMPHRTLLCKQELLADTVWREPGLDIWWKPLHHGVLTSVAHVWTRSGWKCN